jgi:hypothetical protein
METNSQATRLATTAGVLLCALFVQPVNAQIKEYAEPQPGDATSFRQMIVSKPSANSEIFVSLKNRCETEAACGKASGDVCAEAAAVLLGNDPPDNFRDMGSVQKTKIAIRLLERGVDSSNLAAARAYDLYAKPDVVGFLTGGVADSYRAAELLELMTKRNYAGATLRKARSSVSLFSIMTPESEKRQQCDLAKQMLGGGKLDADSKVIANDILDSTICKNLAATAAAAAAAQPQN